MVGDCFFSFFYSFLPETQDIEDHPSAKPEFWESLLTDVQGVITLP